MSRASDNSMVLFVKGFRKKELKKIPNNGTEKYVITLNSTWFPAVPKRNSKVFPDETRNASVEVPVSARG